MKKSNHQANIVRITEILPHNNADALEIIPVGGYQVVSKKGQFKIGDLAVYFQPDSVVPQTEPFRFIWEPYSREIVDNNISGNDIPHRYWEQVPIKRRRITVKRLRGQWSEGLLLPVTDFSGQLIHDPEMSYGWLKEGDDVSSIIGIEHYEPEEETGNTRGANEPAPKKRPKTLKAWFFYLFYKFGILQRKTGGEDTEQGYNLPVYDVEAFKNYKDVFVPEEMVFVTEKIHGSNARFTYIDGHMYAGSRKLWKSINSNCIWRKAVRQNPWIESWCRAHEGSILYGEVIPTQSKFTYGSVTDEVRFFVFDMFKDGEWKKPFVIGGNRKPMPLFPTVVPVLYYGPYTKDVIESFIDGDSQVLGATHIREGIVVTPEIERHERGLDRVQLKLVSNAFLEKDGK